MGLILVFLMLMVVYLLIMLGRWGIMSWWKGWLSVNMSLLIGWFFIFVDVSWIIRMGIILFYRWLIVWIYLNWLKLLRRSCRYLVIGFLRNLLWMCMMRWIEEKMM